MNTNDDVAGFASPPTAARTEEESSTGKKSKSITTLPLQWCSQCQVTWLETIYTKCPSHNSPNEEIGWISEFEDE